MDYLVIDYFSFALSQKANVLPDDLPDNGKINFAYVWFKIEGGQTVAEFAVCWKQQVTRLRLNAWTWLSTVLISALQLVAPCFAFCVVHLDATSQGVGGRQSQNCILLHFSSSLMRSSVAYLFVTRSWSLDNVVSTISVPYHFYSS